MYSSSFRAVSEQFRSSFKAISEQFKRNFRAISEQFRSSFRAFSKQFQSSLIKKNLSNFWGVSEQFQGSFGAVSEQIEYIICSIEDSVKRLSSTAIKMWWITSFRAVSEQFSSRLGADWWRYSSTEDPSLIAIPTLDEIELQC